MAINVALPFDAKTARTVLSDLDSAEVFQPDQARIKSYDLERVNGYPVLLGDQAVLFTGNATNRRIYERLSSSAESTGGTLLSTLYSWVHLLEGGKPVILNTGDTSSPVESATLEFIVHFSQRRKGGVGFKDVDMDTLLLDLTGYSDKMQSQTVKLMASKVPAIAYKLSPRERPEITEENINRYLWEGGFPAHR